jgi:hypothetical protein
MRLPGETHGLTMRFTPIPNSWARRALINIYLSSDYSHILDAARAS